MLLKYDPWSRRLVHVMRKVAHLSHKQVKPGYQHPLGYAWMIFNSMADIQQLATLLISTM